MKKFYVKRLKEYENIEYEEDRVIVGFKAINAARKINKGNPKGDFGKLMKKTQALAKAKGFKLSDVKTTIQQVREIIKKSKK